MGKKLLTEEVHWPPLYAQCLLPKSLYHQVMHIIMCSLAQ